MTRMWTVVTLQMVCWRAKVALALLAIGGVLDVLRHAL